MEDLINEINSRGYRINNLFQLETDFWRCNIRDMNQFFFDFASGKSAREALENALMKTKKSSVKEDFSDVLA